MQLTITTKFHLGFSKPNTNEKNNIKRMQLLLTIVYNETVINIKLQFDRPISNAEIIPVGMTFFKKSFQLSITASRFLTLEMISLSIPAMRKVMVKCIMVVDMGKWNLLNIHLL